MPLTIAGCQFNFSAYALTFEMPSVEKGSKALLETTAIETSILFAFRISKIAGKSSEKNCYLQLHVISDFAFVIK